MTQSVEAIATARDAGSEVAQATTHAEMLEEALLAVAGQLTALRARAEAERASLLEKLDRAHAELDEMAARQAAEGRRGREHDASSGSETDAAIAATTRALEALVAQSTAGRRAESATAEAESARALLEGAVSDAERAAQASEEARIRAEASTEAADAAILGALAEAEDARSERDEAKRALAALRGEHDAGVEELREEITSLRDALDALSSRYNQAEGELSDLRIELRKRTEQLEGARAASAEIALRAAQSDVLERSQRAHDEAIDALSRERAKHEQELAEASRRAAQLQARVDDLTLELDRARVALADLSSRLVQPTPAPPPGQLEAAIERMRMPTPPPVEEPRVARISTSYSVTDIAPEHTSPSPARRRPSTSPPGEHDPHERSRTDRPRR